MRTAAELAAAVAAGDPAARVALAWHHQLAAEPEVAIELLAGFAPADAGLAVDAATVRGLAQQDVGDAGAEASYRAALARGAELGDDPRTARALWEFGTMTDDRALVERAAQIWAACDPAWELVARAWLSPAQAAELRARAIAEFARALGEHPVLIELVVAVGDDRRALAIARATGDRCLRTCAWRVANARQARDPLADGAAVFDEICEGADELARAEILYTKAQFLEHVDDTRAAAVREQSLVLHERVLGAGDPVVAALRTAHAEHLGVDEAVAFWRRCRDRVDAASALFREFTEAIARPLVRERRTEEAATAWREFVAACEAANEPGSPACLDALELAASQDCVPAAERIQLAERATRHHRRSSYRILGNALAAAGRPDSRYAWYRAVDRWIGELVPGVLVPEEAIEKLAAERDLGRAYYDTVIERARAVVGDHDVTIAWLLRGRGALARFRDPTAAAACRDLEQALALFERAGERFRGEALVTVRRLFDHHREQRALAPARHYIERVIARTTGSERRDARGALARLHAGEGQVDVAIEAYTALVDDADPTELAGALAELAKTELHAKRLDAAEATCVRALRALDTATDDWCGSVFYAALGVVRVRGEHADPAFVAAIVQAARGRPSAQKSLQFGELPQILRDALDRALDRPAEVPAALAAQILEAPASAAPYLVLADALTTAGDPRGELIVAQADAKLAARATALVDEHRLAWLGTLPDRHVTWAFGFWKKLWLERAEPEQVRALLDHPSAPFLREFSARSEIAPSILPVVVETQRPALRELHIRDDGAYACAHAAIAWTACPRLATLHLEGMDLVHSLEHPALGELVLDRVPLCADGVWDVPRLRSLDWSGRSTPPDIDVVGAVCRQPLPALRTLMLRDWADDDWLATAAARALVARLDRLAVSQSLFGADPVDRVRAHAADLAHLSVLRIYDVAHDATTAWDAVRAVLPKLELGLGQNNRYTDSLDRRW